MNTSNSLTTSIFSAIPASARGAAEAAYNRPHETDFEALRSNASSQNRRATPKRSLDFVIAALLLILLTPLLALVALSIKLDSNGPVLFTQLRTGLNGKTFAILKFRSMHALQPADKVIQATKGDKRITRVGRLLRKSSIDELPQLLNVLIGNMSLVGPRPHAVAHDHYYGAIIQNYPARFTVKPGITGWAQVNGSRGATPTIADMQTRIDLDTWYANHASMLLDLIILARTPLTVLSTRSAY